VPVAATAQPSTWRHLAAGRGNLSGHSSNDPGRSGWAHVHHGLIVSLKTNAEAGLSRPVTFSEICPFRLGGSVSLLHISNDMVLFLEIWRTWRRETENIFVFLVLVKCILSRYANSEDDFASIFLVNTIRLPTLKNSKAVEDNNALHYTKQRNIFFNNSVWELNKLTQNYQKSPQKLLTLRWLMSYIYGAPILDVSRSHTTTQHSR